jgi:hypothetical protein
MRLLRGTMYGRRAPRNGNCDDYSHSLNPRRVGVVECLPMGNRTGAMPLALV